MQIEQQTHLQSGDLIIPLSQPRLSLQQQGLQAQRLIQHCHATSTFMRKVEVTHLQLLQLCVFGSKCIF